MVVLNLLAEEEKKMFTEPDDSLNFDVLLLCKQPMRSEGVSREAEPDRESLV